MKKTVKRADLSVRGLDVTMLLLDTNALNAEELARIYTSASAYRRKRADEYRFDEDRRMCIGAAHLLDVMLSEFGMAEKDARLCFGENGKPYYPDANVSFSLSHSGGQVLLAYAKGKVLIGCDIEKLRHMKRETAARVLDEVTREEYLRLSEQEADGFFFEAWTRMESYVKATGEGGKAMRGLPREKWRLSMPLPEDLLPEGFAGTVCALKTD